MGEFLPFIIIGAIALLVVGGGIGFFLMSRRDQTPLDNRLESIDKYDDFSEFLEGTEDGEKSNTAASVIEESRKILDPFNDMLAERKFGQNMTVQLRRANVKLTVAEFVASHFVVSVGLFVLGYVFLAGGDILFSSLFALVGFFVPRFYVGRKINQRLHAFENQLPDTLGLWVNALRSGYSVLQAMEAISQDAPEPTKLEFERVVREVQLGIDMPDALAHLLERIQSEDLDLVVTAVNIQREVGGNLAEILEVISHTIRERIKLKGEIRVITSQGRMTGYLISFLPIGLAFFLNFITPGYMGPMFTNRTCGWPLIGLGLGLIGIGTAIIQKIIDIDI